MALRDLIRRRRASRFMDASATMAALLPGRHTNPPERGTYGMLEAYSTCPWVRAIVSKIGEAVGSVTWRLYATRQAGTERGWVKVPRLQKTGVTAREVRTKLVDVPSGVELVEIPDHVLLDLLNESTIAMPGITGRMLTQVYLELVGEAFWLLQVEMRDGVPVPVGYWLIPTTWVVDVPMSTDGVFTIQHDGTTIDIPAAFVIWFTAPNPVNPYGRGSGHMRSLGDEIDTDEFAAKYVRSWFFNSARPDLLVYGPDLDKSATERLEARWLQKMGGYLKQHLPFFINAAVEIKELSQKFSDMQFIDLRKHQRDILIHSRGIPPEVFGIIENSNRSTIDSADYLFNEHVVTPAIKHQRSLLQRRLVPLYDDRLILGFDSPTAEDKEFMLKVATAAPWSIDLNEWRALGGWDHRGEFEGLHMVRMVESAIRLGVDDLNPPATVGDDPPPAGDSPLPARGTSSPRKLAPSHHEHGAGCDCGDPAHIAPPIGERALQAISCASVDALGAGVWVKSVGGEEVAGLASRLGSQMASDVVEAWDAINGSINSSALAAALERGDVEAALAIIDDAKFGEALEPARQTLRQAIVVVGGVASEQLVDALGIDVSFELMSPTVVEELEAYGAELVTNVSDEAIKAMRTLLVDGYSNGRTATEIARQIRHTIGLTEPQVRQAMRLYGEWVEEFGAGSADEMLAKWALKKIRDRAETIAVNELLQAGNRAQDIVWEEASRVGLVDPAKTWREWILSHAPCELCQQMAGRRVRIGQPWSTPTGEHATVSGIHIRCRCSSRLVFV